jgi:hypothetical protein
MALPIFFISLVFVLLSVFKLLTFPETYNFCTARANLQPLNKLDQAGALQNNDVCPSSKPIPGIKVKGVLMSLQARFFAVLFLISAFCVHVLSQDDKPRISEEVTVFADDPIYKELRGLSQSPQAFTGDYATVTDLVMIKNEASFTLKSGEIYFLASASGKAVGAVFIGSGEFYLTPRRLRSKKSTWRCSQMHLR